MTDWAPAPRIKDPALLRLLKFEYDCCEMTGIVYNLHLHHVIFKSHGGDDLRENIICITEAIHGLYHRGDHHTRLRVAQYIDQHRPDIGSYIAEKLGGGEPLLEWFTRHGLAPIGVEAREGNPW